MIGLSSDQASCQPHREQGDRVAVCRHGESVGPPCGRPATAMVGLDTPRYTVTLLWHADMSMTLRRHT